ncbi:hypothetical protein AVEN_77991-1 [Araneus ventricosus]|uniref:Mutator-like transposase domain-containing protein n=1 Tax=Araneus ventricosus TaxID=182803 RepID=A0A4Y2MEL8_ARAVE|nr:hypothetical protein AVEN_77991-1 [Araneus ventricosus]
MVNNRNKSRIRKTKFKGNRHSNRVVSNDSSLDKADEFVPTVSESKLKCDSVLADDFNAVEYNIIFNFQILNSIFSSLCCPECFSSGMILELESLHGLASNMVLKCGNCVYSNFCTSEKVNKMHNINAALVFGMRIIGKGHSAAKKTRRCC